MDPFLILLVIVIYFAGLFTISWITGRRADDKGYYLGNKQSPWYVVAFGLISDSLSGVTFISVPGNVGTTQFSYMQIVFGYVLGYAIIARVLLPLYYRLNLTSIYSYLGIRFGNASQMTGSSFFLLSRILGAAFRLYVSANVLQIFLFNQWNIPFGVTVSIIIVLILLYTYRGGIKTLVWTDGMQSAFLLLGVILSIVVIGREMNLSLGGMINTVAESNYSRIFFWDWKEPDFFFKQFISGAFIAVVMTGLDQNMMQKNLSCRSLPEAQRNLYWFSGTLVFVNLFFVSLGALLYLYASEKGISLPAKTDDLFPMLALDYLGSFAAIVFILGITAATFSSADSVLTTLTTSFCIDFLRFDRSSRFSSRQQTTIRHLVHVLFAVLLLAVIIIFREVSNDAVINSVFRVAGYTYGPLLGLFAFGLFTKRPVWDSFTPVVCVIAPIVCYWLNENSQWLLGGYKFGFELLLLNGFLTFLGLWFVSRDKTSSITLDR